MAASARRRERSRRYAVVQAPAGSGGSMQIELNYHYIDEMSRRMAVWRRSGGTYSATSGMRWDANATAGGACAGVEGMWSRRRGCRHLAHSSPQYTVLSIRVSYCAVSMTTTRTVARR